METKRLIELLAYAKVCFDKCTSPFETMHLIKKKVTANECRELSFKIAEIIEEELSCFLVYELDDKKVKAVLEQAEKEFAETQT